MLPVLCGLALVFYFIKILSLDHLSIKFHSSVHISCMQMLNQIERHRYWELEMCAVVESPQAGSLLPFAIGLHH